MGLNYKYLLYFKKDQLWDVLGALGEISDSEGMVPTTIHFPDHDLVFPLLSSWGEKAEHPCDQPEFQFSLSIFFDKDPTLLEYLYDGDSESMDRSPPDDYKTGKVRIGFIYLTVYADLSKHYAFKRPAEFVLFEFNTTGTRMSLLFSESQSIRSTFCELLVNHGGVIGIFDWENDYGELFWFKGKPMQVSLSRNYMLPDEIEEELKHGW